MKSMLLTGTGVLALLLSNPALAETTTAPPSSPGAAADNAGTAGGPEIIVTANRREERLQDVPIAVSALTDTQIKNQRITNALDLNNVTPGLRIATTDASANPKIFIRGVGLSDFSPSSSYGVGIYVDGVYIGSPMAMLSGFYDIARIEVLRGPQGTLFGRNTTGGAINVITKRPTQQFTGEAAVDYSEFNTVNANAGVGGPIIKDLLAFRLSGQYVRDDGYTVNRLTGDHIGAQNRYAVRGQLLFTPASNVEMLGQVSIFRNRGDSVALKHRALFPVSPQYAGADGLCAPGNYNNGNCTDALGYFDPSSNPYSVEARLEGKDRVNVTTASLQTTIGLEGFDIIALTAYQDVWRDDVENSDAGPNQLIKAIYHAVQREFSQEVRFQSHGQTRMRWVLGAYYMRDYLNDHSSYDFLRDLRVVTPTNPTGADLAAGIAQFSWPYTQKTDSYAVFGQLDYDITDKLTLTGGLRWSADEKSLNYRALAEEDSIFLFQTHQSKTFKDWSGRLGISYKPSPDLNIYATFNRGYKSGGFFGSFATDPAQLEPYKNETLNAYEMGVKTRFFNHLLRTNLSMFYYDYNNQQVFSQVVRNGLTMPVLSNAGKSRAYGGEFEVSADPTSNLSISASASYLNTKIITFTSADPAEAALYQGNVLQHSPKWTLTGSINYSIPLQGGSALVFNANANWRTRVYFDNTQRLRLSSGPLALVDAQAGWRSPGGKFELGVFAKNLFNQVNLTGISPIDSLGLDVLNYGPPRRIGGYARVNF